MAQQVKGDVGVLMTAIQLGGLERQVMDALVKQNLVPDEESAEALLNGLDAWSQGL